MDNRLTRLSALASILAAVATAPAEGHTGTTPPLYKNCTHLNAKYRHGVGKVGARDHTSGVPVKTFLRSNRLYALAMKWNRGLDRDRDGIACESA